MGTQPDSAAAVVVVLMTLVSRVPVVSIAGSVMVVSRVSVVSVTSEIIELVRGNS